MIEQLKKDLKEAMINKDVVRRDILRFVMAQIKNKQIETKQELWDDEIMKILKKEVKQIEEVIGNLSTLGEWEELDNEKQKLEILQWYLPEMLSRERLEEIVGEKIAALWVADPKGKWRGVLIGAIMKEYGTVVDGGLLNQVISSIV